MQNSCDFHPLHPARWQCQLCHGFYCTTCMPEYDPRCPDCSNTLRNLGSSNEVEPFWDRISTFFKYPLQGQSLVVVLLTALIFARSQEGLSSVFMVIMVTGFYMLYSFSVLKNVARGVLKPPSVISAFDGNMKTLVKSIIWVAGLFFVGVSGFLIAPWLGWITLLFVLFLFPASAIIYVNEASVVDAINPARLLDFFLKTTTGYLILFVHLVLILMVITAIENWVGNRELPMYAYMAITGFFSVYSTIIIYALCGYFLLQYQRELGLFAILDNDAVDDVEPLHKVKLFLKKGDYEQALNALNTLIKNNPSQDLTYYKWDLLLQLKRYEDLESKADIVLKRILSVKPFNEIKPFLVYLLNNGGVKIIELKTRIQLANILNKHHLNKWSYVLLKDSHKQYQHDPELVKAMILLADTALAMSQDAFAKKVLSFAFSMASDSEKTIIETKRLAFK